jgi:hypothetical protein
MLHICHALPLQSGPATGAQLTAKPTTGLPAYGNTAGNSSAKPRILVLGTGATVT